MLVPELDVADLATSLRFYGEVLGFRTLFERPDERFAYLERGGVELMLQEATGPGRRFRTAPLDPPLGRGVNFQLRVDDVDAVLAQVVAAGHDVVLAIEERWYRVDVSEPGGRWPTVGPTEAGNRQFVVADPDGYLWRPYLDLGVRPVGGVVVRPERPDDAAAVAEVVMLAFEDERFGPFLDALRQGPGHRPELCLVAEVDEKVVGFVAVGDVELEGGGPDRSVASLSPLAVVPHRQGRGIGSALVRAVLDRARAAGEPLVVLEGSPTYYRRFGFEPAAPLGIDIDLPSWAPPEAAQLVRLDPGAPVPRGRVRYPPAFDLVAD